MQAARRRRELGHLERAIAWVGSASALARQVGVSAQAVQYWKRAGVPPLRCRQIELVTGRQVKCAELREDYVSVPLRRQRRRVLPGTIYLSGPMTGLPQLNFPAFHAEARRLRSAGWRVVNPAEIDLPPDSAWTDFMRADLVDMLLHCDTICMLDGWQKSRGARLEIHIARELEFRVVNAGELG